MMRTPSPMTAQARLPSAGGALRRILEPARRLAASSFAVVVLALSVTLPTYATPPSADASCTVSALNRNAPLQSDYSFTLYNLPGAAAAIGPNAPQIPAPPFRVRVTCSDGTVGETELAYPAFGSTTVYTGEIVWRPATPVPVALGVTAAQPRLNGGESTGNPPAH